MTFERSVSLIAILLAAATPHRDRIDELQVAGIEAQRNMDRFAFAGCPVVAVTQVVQHIATAAIDFGIGIVESPENILGTFAHDVGQHVQAAAVGHAQHDFFDAVVAGFFQCQIQQRNQRFGAFERKRFGTDEFLAHELFKNHRIGQSRQNSNLRVAVSCIRFCDPSMRVCSQLRTS